MNKSKFEVIKFSTSRPNIQRYIGGIDPYKARGKSPLSLFKIKDECEGLTPEMFKYIKEPFGKKLKLKYQSYMVLEVLEVLNTRI